MPEIGELYIKFKADIAAVERALATMEREAEAAGVSVSQSFKKSLKEAEVAAKSASDSASRAAREASKSAADAANKATAEVGKAQRELKRMTADGLSSFGRAMSIGVTAPMLLAARASISAARDFGRLEMALSSVMGSSAAAKVELEKLKSMAMEAPLGDLQVWAKASVQLQGVGFAAEESRKMIETLSHEMTKAGQDQSAMAAVITNLVQIKGVGKLMGDELRETASYLPSFRQALVDAFGTADSQSLMKRGLDATQVIKAAFAEMAKRPKIKLSDEEREIRAMEKSFTELKITFGQTLLPVAKELSKALTPVLKDVNNLLKGMSDEAKEAWVRFGLLAMVVGPTASLTKNLLSLVGVMKDLKVTISGINLLSGSFMGGMAAITAGTVPLLMSENAKAGGIASGRFKAFNPTGRDDRPEFKLDPRVQLGGGRYMERIPGDMSPRNWGVYEMIQNPSYNKLPFLAKPGENTTDFMVPRLIERLNDIEAAMKRNPGSASVLPKVSAGGVRPNGLVVPEDAKSLSTDLIIQLAKAVQTPEGKASCGFFAKSILEATGVEIGKGYGGGAQDLMNRVLKSGGMKVDFADRKPGDLVVYQGAKYGAVQDNGQRSGYHVGVLADDGRVADSSGGRTRLNQKLGLNATIIRPARNGQFDNYGDLLNMQLDAQKQSAMDAKEVAAHAKKAREDAKKAAIQQARDFQMALWGFEDELSGKAPSQSVLLERERKQGRYDHLTKEQYHTLAGLAAQIDRRNAMGERTIPATGGSALLGADPLGMARMGIGAIQWAQGERAGQERRSWMSWQAGLSTQAAEWKRKQDATANERYAEEMRKVTEQAAELGTESEKTGYRLSQMAKQFGVGATEAEALADGMEKAKKILAGEKSLLQMREWRDQVGTLGSILEDGLMRSFDNLRERGFRGFLDGMLSDFRMTTQQIVREWIAAQIKMMVRRNMDSLFNSLVAGAGGGSASKGAVFPNAAAAGGPAYRGMPMVVGEYGREMFVPAENGSIVPAGRTANALGGGDTIIINITVQGAADDRTVDQIATSVAAAVDRAKRRNG